MFSLCSVVYQLCVCAREILANFSEFKLEFVCFFFFFIIADSHILKLRGNKKYFDVFCLFAYFFL